jgi:hypothetical protein
MRQAAVLEHAQVPDAEEHLVVVALAVNRHYLGLIWVALRYGPHISRRVHILLSLAQLYAATVRRAAD